MPTAVRTYSEALDLARPTLEQAHPGAQPLAEGLEDATDYLISFDSDTPLVGSPQVFVRKATGQVWTENMVYVLDKVDHMKPTTR